MAYSALTDPEKHSAILAAYQSLSYHEMQIVERLADQLIAAIKDLNPDKPFGRATALEILGSLGIMIIRKERNDGDKCNVCNHNSTAVDPDSVGDVLPDRPDGL